jgi:acyl carrier protein
MLDKIIAIVSKYSKTPADQITESTSLLSDLKMESMSFIDMICEFEEQFKRRIPERDFRKFITIKKIMAYFEELSKPAESSDSAAGEADTALAARRSHCIVSPMTGRLAETVPELVKSVYGSGYPATYLYNPEEFVKKIDNGEIYPFVAINGDGRATGMISLIRLSVNQNAFELGQLMVAPDYRGTDVAELLISCISGQELKFGVIYSESVTSHKFSQRSCIAAGFVDTALKLNIMPCYEKQDTGRISCVVSCIERGEIELWAYLPDTYKQALVLSLGELTPRIVRNASSTPPENPTKYVINDDELYTSQYVIATITEIGADVEEIAKIADEHAIANNVKSLAVNIPLSCPHNGAAVNALKARGFIFGGIMPRWYPNSDALLMQKLYGNTPDWEAVKLFSDKIQEIAGVIKQDV